MRQRRPQGLLGVRYLWPGKDKRIRQHRDLWWQSGAGRSRLLWFLLQCGLWLRWSIWTAWTAGWRALRRFGTDTRDHQDIGLFRQTLTVARLALAWCIPPRDVYRYALLSRPEAALDYVYGPEINAYHASRSRRLGLNPTSVALHADKFALAERLSDRGIPVVATLACLPSTREPPRLHELMGQSPRVFCKTRRGHGGQGAFTAWRTGEGMSGRTFEGRDLPDTAAVEGAWRRLTSLDDALVQPCLVHHPALAPLANTDDVITVRYISQWQGSSLGGYCAWLEIPSGQNPSTGRTNYVTLPVDIHDGRLMPLPEKPGFTNTELRRAHEIYGLVPEGTSVPGWSRLVESSHAVHRLFPDLWAVAWDWVPTPDGPVLLEGNTAWGVTMPQRLLGGLFARDLMSRGSVR